MSSPNSNFVANQWRRLYDCCGQRVQTYRLETLLGGLMYELIGDCQVAPSSQAVGTGAVTDVSTARTSPVPAVLDLMDVFPHPDVQAGATPEASAFASHDALGRVVTWAVGLLIDGLLPAMTGQHCSHFRQQHAGQPR